jgi:hypothetical protein
MGGGRVPPAESCAPAALAPPLPPAQGRAARAPRILPLVASRVSAAYEPHGRWRTPRKPWRLRSPASELPCGSVLARDAGVPLRAR